MLEILVRNQFMLKHKYNNGYKYQQKTKNLDYISQNFTYKYYKAYLMMVKKHNSSYHQGI